VTVAVTRRPRPAVAADAPLHARLTLEGELLGAPASFRASMGDGWKLAAKLEKVSLAAALDELCQGAMLPLFDGVTLAITAVLDSATGTLGLDAELRDADIDPGAPFRIDTLVFKAAVKAGALQSLSITASGKVTLADGCTLELNAAAFTFEAAAKRWTVSGQVTLKLLEHSAAVALTYASEPGVRRLSASVQADPPVTLVDLGFAKLLLSSLDLCVRQAPGKRTEWKLKAKSRVEVEEIGAIEGTLEASNRALALTGVTPLVLPFTVGDRTVRFVAQLQRLGITRADTADTRWTLGAEATLALENLPDGLKQVFTAPLKVCFWLGRKAGQTLLELTLKGALRHQFTPRDIVLKDPGTGEELRIELSQYGAVGFELADFKVTIAGGGVSVGVTTGVGLPWRLNEIFGVENGQPKHVILRTLPREGEPGAEHYTRVAWTLGRARSGGGKGTAFSFQLLNAPVLRKYLDVGEGRWNLDLGSIGKLWLELPKFSFVAERGAFECEVKGGRDGPLSIPLWLLRAVLLRAFPGREQEIDRVVPKAIPISDIQAFKDGRLQVDPLLSYIGGFVTDPGVLAVLRAVATKVAGVADALPDDLKPYLGFTVPTEFSAAISLRPGSAEVRVGLAVKGSAPDEGLRMLIPTLEGVMFGINFRGFSLGPVLAGKLWRLDLDLDANVFNLPEIAIGMVAPPPLVPAREQYNRIRLRKVVVMIVIIPSTPPIPVPVPLFYDEAAFEVRTLLGFQGGMAGRFYPEPDLLGMLKLLYRLYRFVTTPDPLVTKDLSDDMKLRFRLGKPGYLQLPPWMGENLWIGSRDGYLIDLAPLDLLAKVLNTLKATRINDVVALLPFKDRVFVVGGTMPDGRVVPPLQLWGLTLRGTGLLTTPHEFLAQGAWQSAGYPSAEAAAEALGLSGAPVTPASQGMVVMARGRLDSMLARVEGDYALAAVQDRSFVTGVRFRGRIGPEGSPVQAIDLLLAARMVLSTDRGEFYGDLEAHLMVVGVKLFQAKAKVAARRDVLKLDGTVSLFPPEAPLALSGAGTASIASSGVEVDAKLTVIGLGFIPLAGASFRLRPNELNLHAWWLGIETDFAVETASDTVTVTSRAAITPAAVRSRCAYHVPSRSVSGWLDAQFAGVQFRADFNSAVGRAACWVSLFGLRLVDGEIWVTGEVYRLKATYHVFPPNPVLTFDIGGDGWLNARGLSLEFSGGIGIEVGGVRIAWLAASASITPGGVGSTLRASLGPLSTDARSGFYDFPPRGVCFLMQWQLGAIVYVAAWPGGVEIWVHGWPWPWKPDGWPIPAAVVAGDDVVSGEPPPAWGEDDFWAFVSGGHLLGRGEVADDPVRPIRLQRMLGHLRAHAIAEEVNGRAWERVTLSRPGAAAPVDPFAGLASEAEDEIRLHGANLPPEARERAARRVRTLRRLVLEQPLHPTEREVPVLELAGEDFALRAALEAGPPRHYAAELARLLLEDEAG